MNLPRLIDNSKLSAESKEIIKRKLYLYEKMEKAAISADELIELSELFSLPHN